MPTAKIFWSGNSQAVRLPKEYRFADGLREVSVRREGDYLILIPLTPETWPDEFWDAFGSLPEGLERPPQRRQVREDLGD